MQPQGSSGLKVWEESLSLKGCPLDPQTGRLNPGGESEEASLPLLKCPEARHPTGQLLSSRTCGRCDNRHLVGFLTGSAPAANTHILTVGAVGPPPDPVSAVQQGGLRSFTVDVVQEDQTDTLAERPI